MIGRLPARGYAVADAIPLELRLINESGQRVHRVKVKLVRVCIQLHGHRSNSI